MTFQADKVTAFYDAHDRKLLSDYIRSSPRIVAAIEHALRHIPTSSRRILDIGCGIGWSSREIAAHFPHAHVTAVDLSPRLIEVATRLSTGIANLSFSTQNVLDESWPPLAHRFDAIVLLDVYEHVPAAERRGFHGSLARLLADKGILILTCPTPEHQDFLRRHQPSGLQPFDEDVDEQVAETLAADIGGRVIEFGRKTIWRPNDYSHITIARAGIELPNSAREVKLEPVPARRARLAERMGLRVADSGLILRTGNGPVICVAADPSSMQPDTFSGDLMSRLPFSILGIHGRPHLKDDEGNMLLPERSLLEQVAGKLRRTLGRGAADGGSYVDSAIATYFRLHNISVVMAEHGILGVEMMGPAKLAGIPLIACFRGDDVYQETIVRGTGRRYPELFQQAAAITVTSQHMRRQLISLGAPEQKIVTVPCWADLQAFNGGDPAAAPPHFLAAGPLVEKSAPHLLVVAMSHVLAQCPEARLKIIGDGPLLSISRQIATSLEVDHAVDFVRWQGRRHLADSLRICRALVQHSITAADGDCEAMPCAIVEAQAAGVPVIVTRHAGLPELLDGDRTGLLVDEQDVRGMAALMVRLAKDPQEAATLGRAGRPFIQAAGLTLDRALERMTAVLQAAISKV